MQDFWLRERDAMLEADHYLRMFDLVPERAAETAHLEATTLFVDRAARPNLR